MAKTITWGLIYNGYLYGMSGDKYVQRWQINSKNTVNLPSALSGRNLVLAGANEAPQPWPEEKSKAVSLNVPYWKQTDNYRDANRTCFSSSMAMIIEYLLPDELPNDDTYVKTVFSIGDTTDPNVQVKALAHHGVIGNYRQDMDFTDLDRELAMGYPVGIGILHRGPLTAPTGGHWIVCVGRNEDGTQYQFNDPYGSLGDGYQGDVNNGKKVWYSRSTLSARWTAEGKNSGWGMICRKK